VSIWWCKIMSNFLSQDNLAEILLHIMDTIIGVITLIFVIKGVEAAVPAFGKYKEKRHGAIWDFYTNLSTFIYRLRLTIGSKDNLSNVTKYLYTGEMPTAERDKREVEMFLDLTKKFLHFLSTGTGQVPATDNFDEWNKKRTILINFLNKVLYIGVRVDIADADAEMDDKEKALINEIDVVLDAIGCIEKEIKKVVFELKKEIDSSK